MAYQKELADDRGNLYPRKNQYIIDKIAGKNPDKNSHPYIKKLSQYEKKEKELLDLASKEADEWAKTHQTDKKFADLNKKHHIANKMLSFYEENKDLSYEAELKYKEANLYIKEIPEIIKHDLALKSQLEARSTRLKDLSDDEIKKAQAEVEKDKGLLKEKYDQDLANLKESFDKNLISKKAYKSEKEKYKKRFKDSSLAAEFKNPKTSLEEEIKSINYKIKQDFKNSMKSLIQT